MERISTKGKDLENYVEHPVAKASRLAAIEHLNYHKFVIQEFINTSEFDEKSKDKQEAIAILHTSILNVIDYLTLK